VRAIPRLRLTGCGVQLDPILQAKDPFRRTALMDDAVELILVDDEHKARCREPQRRRTRRL
jgi:hypothetical protein